MADKINKNCIDEAFKGLPNFSKKELQDYANRVLKKARDFDPLRSSEAIDKAIQETKDEVEMQLFHEAQQNAQNILAFKANAKAIRDGKANFEGILSGRSLRRKGEADSNYRMRNIPDSQEAEYETSIKSYVNLTREEVSRFAKGKDDTEIADVFDGKHSDDPFINKVSETFKKYFDDMQFRLVESGAMTSEEFHAKRYFGAVHDAERVMNAGRSWAKMAVDKRLGKFKPEDSKNWWKEKIKAGIDMFETFKNTNAVDIDGNLSEPKADKILDKNFNNITTNAGDIFTKSNVVNEREAIERKRKLFFVWKNLRSQLDYNADCGNGNLFHMFVRDMKANSNRVGVANVWGSNPTTMFKDLRRVQQEVSPKSLEWWTHTGWMYDNIMGIDRLNTAPGVSTFFMNQRSWTSMARLPTIALQSLSDIGYISSFSQRFGVNYFAAWGHHVTNLFNNGIIKDDARIYAAKMMKTQVDHHLGYLGRWANDLGVSSITNKISTAYFRLNLLEAFDRGNKTGNIALMMKAFGEKSNLGWGELPDGSRKMLERFIDDKEWDLLRKNNEGNLFTTDNVLSLSQQQIEAHYAGTDKSVPLNKYQNDLYRRVYGMFLTNVQNTVLNPRSWENATLQRGTKTGSTNGVIMREITQFKSYALAYVDRVLVDGARNADGAQQKLLWATSMLIGTIPLAYLSYTLDNLAKGVSNADPSKMNVPQRLQYTLNMIAPSLSIFAGFLDPRNQNSSSLWSLIGSPSLRLISDVISTAIAGTEAIISGKQSDKKRAKKNAVAAAGYFLPIGNFPGISPMVREIMGDESHLDPGQRHIYGR